ncbi:HAD-IB family phosphatase [Candidatus Woesearchaeota archaeon]|nr:HAD-IB family phosphatase [Candidatus Woesearchaeota archaeon]
MAKDKIKLIFFDMEGVIFESGIIEERKDVAASVWTALGNSLGKECRKKEDEGKIMWAEGKFNNYIEWCEWTLKLFQKHNLTMKHFYDVINKVKYIDGAKETFKELKKKGYKTVIISGGLKNLANRAIRDLDIDTTFAAVEYFFDDKTEKLVSWNILPTDYEGKIDFLRLMMREYKLHPQECAFIGDGVNDIPPAKEVGLSVAFNARKELQEVATYSINQKRKNLKAILKYF